MEKPTVPQTYKELKAHITVKGAEMPRRLAQIAEFALRHPDDMAFGTVASLSKAANVQPSALVRFSQSLGFSGFSDLQELFQERLRGQKSDYQSRIQHLRETAATSGPGFVMEGFFAAAEQSLKSARESIEPKALQQAVHVLAKAETIYLVGMRRSFPIATYMNYALSKLGIKHVLVDGTGGLGLDNLSFATKKDCVFAVSFAPYASESIGYAQTASERGVPVVSITDSAFSPLVAISKAWLEVNEADFEGFRSLSATMALVMALTVAVAEIRESH